MSPLTVRGGQIAPSNLVCEECPLNDECRFDERPRGGFKKKGGRPHYIGFRLIADPTERNANSAGAMEDFVTCFDYVETKQPREVMGNILRAQGKNGELVQIIKQEGERVMKRYRVGINAFGQVIKPQSEIIDILKSVKGLKMNLDDHGQAVDWKTVVVEVEVPKYDEVIERQGDYGQQIMKRAFADQADVEAIQERAWEDAQRRMAQEQDVVPKAEPAKKTA